MTSSNNETAEMVAKTLRGLLHDDSTDEECQLACSLLQRLASQIGLDVEHTEELEDQIASMLLGRFRDHSLTLVAMGSQMLVVNNADGGQVFARISEARND